MKTEQPAKERWYTVIGHPDSRCPEVVCYSGPDQAEAELATAAAKRAGMTVSVDEAISYAPPERQPTCRCGHPAAQMICPYGHMTECHYPLTCREAMCGHFLADPDADVAPDYDPSAPPPGPAVQILPTDRLYETSLDTDDPECLCSRCGHRIRGVPIRAWPDTGGEYIFHPACLGATAADGDDDCEEEDCL